MSLILFGLVTLSELLTLFRYSMQKERPLKWAEMAEKSIKNEYNIIKSVSLEIITNFSRKVNSSFEVKLY